MAGVVHDGCQLGHHPSVCHLLESSMELVLDLVLELVLFTTH